MEETQQLQAPTQLERAKAVDSFNKLYEKGTRKKINPSKSRQGRAVLVNGALRNPQWDRSYGRGMGSGRLLGPRHARTLKDYQIEALKQEAIDMRAETKDYIDNALYDLSKFDNPYKDFRNYLRTLQVKEGRRARDIECKVSRELDMRWTVGTKAGAETFTVKLPEAA